MLSCKPSSSLEDKQGSDSELHLRDWAILNLDYLNQCPAFVLAPQPTPVLTAVRRRDCRPPARALSVSRAPAVLLAEKQGKPARAELSAGAVAAGQTNPQLHSASYQPSG